MGKSINEVNYLKNIYILSNIKYVAKGYLKNNKDYFKTV